MASDSGAGGSWVPKGTPFLRLPPLSFEVARTGVSGVLASPPGFQGFCVEVTPAVSLELLLLLWGLSTGPASAQEAVPRGL